MKLLVRLRPRLGYANVAATLALFLVLGGGAAFAATQLPKNSVGAKQLKKHAVTANKLASSAVSQLKGATGAQGAKGAKGATGPRGSTGSTGPKGDTGAAGKDAGPAYVASSGEEGAAFPAGEHTQATPVALKNIPAGSYTVNLTAEVFNSGKGALVIECGISAVGGSPADLEPEAGIYNLPAKSGSFSSIDSIAQQTVVRFGSDGGELAVSCFLLEGKVEEGSIPNESSAGVVIPKLIATKVTSFSQQEFASPPVSGSVVRRLGLGG